MEIRCKCGATYGDESRIGIHCPICGTTVRRVSEGEQFTKKVEKYELLMYDTKTVRYLKKRSLGIERYSEPYTVYRIRASKDFGDVKKGDLGGYVTLDTEIDERGIAWVYDDSVLISSVLKGDAKIKSSVIANSTIECKSITIENSIIVDSTIFTGSITFDGIWYEAIYKNTPSRIVDRMLIDTIITSTSLLMSDRYVLPPNTNILRECGPLEDGTELINLYHKNHTGSITLNCENDKSGDEGDDTVENNDVHSEPAYDTLEELAKFQKSLYSTYTPKEKPKFLQLAVHASDCSTLYENKKYIPPIFPVDNCDDECDDEPEETLDMTKMCVDNDNDDSKLELSNIRITRNAAVPLDLTYRDKDGTNISCIIMKIQETSSSGEPLYHKVYTSEGVCPCCGDRYGRCICEPDDLFSDYETYTLSELLESLCIDITFNK